MGPSRLEHVLRNRVALAGIHDFLRPLLRLLKFVLKQIEARQAKPGRRSLRGSLPQVTLGEIILALSQRDLAEAVQCGGMAWLQLYTFFECLLRQRLLSRIETRPAEPIPGIGVIGREFHGFLKFRDRFGKTSFLPN